MRTHTDEADNAMYKNCATAHLYHGISICIVLVSRICYHISARDKYNIMFIMILRAVVHESLAITTSPEFVYERNSEWGGENPGIMATKQESSLIAILFFCHFSLLI